MSTAAGTYSITAIVYLFSLLISQLISPTYGRRSGTGVLYVLIYSRQKSVAAC